MKLEQEVSVNDISRISAGTVVKGEMYSDCDIRVDGEVEGKLVSKGKIVVGNQAKVRGDIICSNVDFWGTLDGSVTVRDTLNLKSTASVKGSIKVNKIQVEMGAQINGECKMLKSEDFDKQTAPAVK